MGASAYGDSKKFQKQIKETYEILEEGFRLDLSFFNHFQFIDLAYLQKNFLLC